MSFHSEEKTASTFSIFSLSLSSSLEVGSYNTVRCALAALGSIGREKEQKEEEKEERLSKKNAGPKLGAAFCTLYLVVETLAGRPADRILKAGFSGVAATTLGQRRRKRRRRRGLRTSCFASVVSKGGLRDAGRRAVMLPNRRHGWLADWQARLSKREDTSENVAGQGNSSSLPSERQDSLEKMNV